MHYCMDQQADLFKTIVHYSNFVNYCARVGSNWIRLTFVCCHSSATPSVTDDDKESDKVGNICAALGNFYRRESHYSIAHTSMRRRYGA
jgi:hypothetical protein